jgi:transcriptional repressor NrdR
VSAVNISDQLRRRIAYIGIQRAERPSAFARASIADYGFGHMDCPSCSARMAVSDTHKVKANPQVVRRRRVCPRCKTTFQTEERPRLWILRQGKEEPFLRGVLLASLRRAAADHRPAVADGLLSEAVRRVVVSMLARGTDRPTAEEVRHLTGRVLQELGLQDVAARYDPSLDPDSLLVDKRGDPPRQEPFDRDKLKGSIAGASAGFLDPVGVEAAVVEIETELGARSGASEDSAEIRRLVDLALRRRDERAFIRYALGDSDAESLNEFLDRVAPAAQVRKRGSDAVVMFEGDKLTKSMLRSFTPDRRGEYASEIDEFVIAEERRIRAKMGTDFDPEPTVNIGERVLEWLFDRSELAWANYWLVFESHHRSGSGGGPAQQLALAQTEMRLKRERILYAPGDDAAE